MTRHIEAAQRVLADLSVGRRIADPVLVVVAHADDETIGLGTRLRLFDRLTLVHLTDGAPLSLGDRRVERTALRRAELAAALAILEVRGKRIALDFGDQQLALVLDDLTAALARRVAAARFVFSHAYEGGHPDHDAAALAIAGICARRGARAPIRFEFSGYHWHNGRLAFNTFCGDGPAPAVRLKLSDEDVARRRRAFDAYPSQAGVLRKFPRDEETFRLAPDYDFRRPPPPGTFNYDRHGWPLTGELWLRHARAHLDRVAAERSRGENRNTPS